LFSGKFETPHVVFYSDELFLNKTLREKNTSIDESAFALLRRDKSAIASVASAFAATASADKSKDKRVDKPKRHPVRRSFRGQSLLQHKLEKNGTSPKTWCWPIFRIGKFEPAVSQNDPAEIGRNRSGKFL